MALDLVEEFKAPVAGSVVVRAFNNGELGSSCFQQQQVDVITLTERGTSKCASGESR